MVSVEDQICNGRGSSRISRILQPLWQGSRLHLQLHLHQLLVADQMYELIAGLLFLLFVVGLGLRDLYLHRRSACRLLNRRLDPSFSGGGICCMLPYPQHLYLPPRHLLPASIHPHRHFVCQHLYPRLLPIVLKHPQHISRQIQMLDLARSSLL